MFIISGFFNILFKQFEDTDIDVHKIFSDFKTDLTVLDDPVKKIDAGILGRYLEQLVFRKNNHRIGLETGFIIPFTLTGAIFNVYHQNDKVYEVFEDLELLDPFVNDISQYSTKVEGDLFYYEVSVNKEFIKRYPVAARQWIEMEYGIALQYAHSFTGRQLHPLRAHSIYKKDGEPDLLEEYLDCPVEFEKEKLALVFNKSILDLSVMTAKREVLPIFTELMTGIRETRQDQLFSDSVRRYILHSISQSGLSLKSVAEKFNMSERSMQRKLKEEGFSYQTILDRLRMELARDYLKKKTPLTEIAFLLGFESQSAFNKFYRKHFDNTPGKFK